MVYYLLSLEARNFIISGCNATLREKIDDTLTFPTPYYFHFISFAFVQLTYLPLPSKKEMFHDCYCDSINLKIHTGNIDCGRGVLSMI